MRLRPLFIGAAALALPHAANAADRWLLHDAVGASDAWTISGSERVRYEGLDGQFRPGANSTEHLTSLRTTLFAQYASGPIRIGGEMYDSRAYGGRTDGSIGTGEINTFELVQGYVAADFKAPFGPGSTASVQAGRMTLNLGSRRLVAADDYRNTINSYTGVKLEAKTASNQRLTLIYTLPQIRLPDDLPSVVHNRTHFDRESNGLTLWGGAFSTPGLPDGMLFDAAFYGLGEKDFSGHATRDRRLRTASARVIRNPAPGTVDFEAEAAYQYGSISASTAPGAARLDVAASLVHLDIGYQFTGPWKAHLSAEYDRASGDDAKSSYGRFDTLFGSRRNEYGPPGIYAAIGRANISTPGIRLEVTPNARWDAFAVYRGLWAASATDGFSTTGVRDPTGKAGHYAGQQVEGRVRYWLAPDALRLEANGAVLVKDGLLKDAPNAPHHGTTHYVALSLTASF